MDPISQCAYDVLMYASKLDLETRNTMDTFLKSEDLTSYDSEEIINAVKELIENNLIDFKEIRILNNPFDGFFKGITSLGYQWLD